MRLIIKDVKIVRGENQQICRIGYLAEMYRKTLNV